MGKPVKVSPELYDRLARTAHERGTTIQEALRLEMEETRARAERLGQEVARAKEAVTLKDQDLARATADTRRSAAAAAAEGEKGRREALRVRELDQQCRQAQEELSSLRELADDLEVELDAARGRAKAAERSRAGWAVVTLLLGVVVLVLAARAFRESARPPQERREPEQALPPSSTPEALLYTGAWR
jgi:small-conductance mechanosensitive channel